MFSTRPRFSAPLFGPTFLNRSLFALPTAFLFMNESERPEDTKDSEVTFSFEPLKSTEEGTELFKRHVYIVYKLLSNIEYSIQSLSDQLVEKIALFPWEAV